LTLSVVVVTWNSGPDIAACLDSLSPGCPMEAIVIDNASRDDTLRQLEGRNDIRLVRNSRNLGYARANNQGIALARGELVLLLNPDTRVEPGALDRLVRCLDEDPALGAVAPRLVSPDGTTQQSVRAFPTAGSLLWELVGLARLFPRNRRFGGWRMSWFDYDRPAEIDQPMASCLIVRRSVLQQLGGFDETFPIFCNDVDLSYRMKLAGWTTRYLPEARVVHRRGASTAQARPRMITESHRSLFRFLRKHDRSGLFWLKAVFLLPMLESTAVARRVLYRLRRR